MKKTLLQLWHGIIYALIILAFICLFFAPVTGFHHMIQCGVLTAIFLDGEEHLGNYPVWGEYEVRISPVRFAASVLLCVFCIFFSLKYTFHPKLQTLVAKRVADLEARYPLRPSLYFWIGILSPMVIIGASFFMLFPLFIIQFGFSFVAFIGGFCSIVSFLRDRWFYRFVTFFTTLFAFIIFFRGLLMLFEML